MLVLITVSNCILTMVMAKPMQLTIVSAVPFNASGALFATNVENKGESAITTMPQNNRKPINTVGDARVKTKGDSRQHKQDKPKKSRAICLTPNRCER